MFCKECGVELNDDALFCPECGAPVEKKQANSKGVEWENSSFNNFDGQTTNPYVKRYLILLTCSMVVMIILLVCIFSVLTLNNKHNKAEKLLIVVQKYDDEMSDMTQFWSAIETGGMISLNFSELSGNITTLINPYGAENNQGYYYVKGAVFNYLASQGWKLVSADHPNYYFIK